MIFHSLSFQDGVVTAVAQGHADEVVRNFHSVCSILLTSGPWRFTKVHGHVHDLTELDSDMSWSLEAKFKNKLGMQRIG